MTRWQRFLRAWMKRIRWSRRGRHAWLYADDLRNDIPKCWCGSPMRERAGYMMGGKSDWIAYSCPLDRPWNFWRHSPWTTVRDIRSIRDE